MPWLNRLLGSESPKLAHPVKLAIGLLMQKSRRFEHVLIRRDGYLLPFLATSNVALTYWVVPDLVDPTEEFVRSILRPGDVFVDVGANVGSVASLAAGLVGRGGRVVAIEPHPRTFANLQRTISANALENVVCRDVACGAAVGAARLTDEARKDDNNRLDEEDGGIPVRVTTLSEVLRELSIEKVNLLKIDVEGFECAVLRGVVEDFPRIEALYIEVIDANLQRYGDSTTTICSLLEANGFTCFRLASDPTNLAAVSTADKLASLGDAFAPILVSPANSDGS